MIGMQKELDVNIQSQTGALLQYFLINELKADCALSDPVEIDDMVINLVQGHGFTGAAGEMLTIWNGSQFDQSAVVSVDDDAVTIATPVGTAHPVDGTIVVRGSKYLNIDGSVTPVTFRFKPRGIIPIDISMIIISGESGSSVPDNGTFLGQAMLTNGMYVRKVDGMNFNLGNYKKCSDFRHSGAEVTYSDKAPSGTNATDIIFKLEQYFGQVIRLDPRSNDELIAVIRDEITINSLRISVVGSYTSGE